VPPAGTRRKGRKLSSAFVQVEATYRLPGAWPTIRGTVVRSGVTHRAIALAVVPALLIAAAPARAVASVEDPRRGLSAQDIGGISWPTTRHSRGSLRRVTSMLSTS